MPQYIDTILRIVTAIADVFTIAASGIAIYLVIAKRHVISSVFRVLLSFSSQITLIELKTKLERLNDLNVNDPDQKITVINVLHEIIGQIRGNKNLLKQCEGLISRIATVCEDKRRLTEPNKRSLVSELREQLRNIDVQNYSDIIGE
jgi:hypothetical protein